MAGFQPGCLWSGPQLPLLYLRIICFPAWVPLVGSPAASILSSNHLFPSLGTSGRVSGSFYSIFEVFVSHVPLVGSPAASALSSNHLSPSLGASDRTSGCFCFIFESFVSQPGCLCSGRGLPLFYFAIMRLPIWLPLVGPPAASVLFSNHLFPNLGASGRASGCLCFIFESFSVSQSGCLWWGAFGRVPLVTSTLSSNYLFSSLGTS